MKKILNIPILAILGLALTFNACDEYNENVPVVEHLSLKIVNEATSNQTITFVALVGYEFNNLNIGKGSSQTFALDKGMPGGYEDIYVKVGLGFIGALNTTVDFYAGETRTITLKGCRGYEGCPGLFLE